MSDRAGRRLFSARIALAVVVVTAISAIAQENPPQTGAVLA